MDCGLRTTEYIKHGPGIKCELRAVLVRLSQSPSLLITGSRSLARLPQENLKNLTLALRAREKKNELDLWASLSFSLIILSLDPNSVNRV